MGRSPYHPWAAVVTQCGFGFGLVVLGGLSDPDVGGVVIGYPVGSGRLLVLVLLLVPIGFSDSVRSAG